MNNCFSNHKDWQERAMAAEKELENLKLLASYSEDIVKMWPNITIRTLYKMTEKVALLKEALLLK